MVYPLVSGGEVQIHQGMPKWLQVHIVPDGYWCSIALPPVVEQNITKNPIKKVEKMRRSWSLEGTSETISPLVTGVRSSFLVEINLLNTYQNICDDQHFPELNYTTWHANAPYMKTWLHDWNKENQYMMQHSRITILCSVLTKSALSSRFAVVWYSFSLLPIAVEMMVKKK